MPEKLIIQFVHYLLCNAPEFFSPEQYKWNNNNNLCSGIFTNENLPFMCFYIQKHCLVAINKIF